MPREFDPGYRGRYRRLVLNCPDESVYPADSFRVEWGPIFHRGRLDGSARVLVIGQDPATHETITRRILVGEAGQRVQGLLARLGITRSYVFVNTFLYSVYGQGGGTRHIGDPAITRYRNRWIDAIVDHQQIEAIISLGQLADRAYQAWRTTPVGLGHQGRGVSATLRVVERRRRRPARRRDRGRPSAVAAIRLDDHRRRPGTDPGDRPPAGPSRVDGGPRRVGDPHWHGCPAEAGDHHSHRAQAVPHLARALGRGPCPSW